MTVEGQELPGSERAASPSLRHELQTPINHIIGYGEMLIEEAGDQGRDDRIVVLRTVVDLGKQAHRLINDALPPGDRGAASLDLPGLKLRLHTPLDRIIQDCKSLRDGSGEPGNEGLGRDLEKILTAAARLLELAGRGVVPGPEGFC